MKYLVSNSQTLFSYDNIERASVLDVLLYFINISVISLDTETTGLDPHCEKIILLQLADEKNQYVIDTLTVDISKFKDLLEDEDYGKVFDKEHLKEEMADAMQCMFSIYLDICEKQDFDIEEIFDEIIVKNKKWREKAPFYVKNQK